MKTPYRGFKIKKFSKNLIITFVMLWYTSLVRFLLKWPSVSRQAFREEQQKREDAENKVQILGQRLQMNIWEVLIYILYSSFLFSHLLVSVEYMDVFTFHFLFIYIFNVILICFQPSYSFGFLRCDLRMSESLKWS